MNVVTNNTEQCQQALNALLEVIDPEIGLNVVDLGLIYQVDFDDQEKKIFCTMTLTTQFCPMGDSITQAAEEVLHSTFPNYHIALELSFNPPWNAQMISPEGREFLNER
ncbi:MAG: metal-sulfur cluster assembly factor [Bacteroidetes bacterium]|nr:metal-sulfur cluster assembly factor [Bacteroidota bacterium]